MNAEPMTLFDLPEIRNHPACYSPEVIAVLAELIRPGEHVHDCYAGTGDRLGALCDRIGATFTGAKALPQPCAQARVVAGRLP